MHESMYQHPIVTENMEKLENIGIKMVHPHLTEGKAKLADNDEIVELVISELAVKDLDGTRIVITGGPTYESIDSVRGITNLSSGRMGISLAKNAVLRGADVVLIYGPGKMNPPSWIKTVKVISGEQMCSATKAAMEEADVLISAAAIADYQPIISMDGKLQSGGELAIEMKPTAKLISEIRSRYPNKIIIGFKLEKENLVEKAYNKLLKDNLDLIVANSVEAIGAEETDVHIIDRGKRVTSFSGAKSQIAGFVLDAVVGLVEIREKALNL